SRPGARPGARAARSARWWPSSGCPSRARPCPGCARTSTGRGRSPAAKRRCMHSSAAGSSASARRRRGGSPRASASRRAPTRAAPLAFVLREDLAWLLAPTQGTGDLPSAARAVLAHLERHGASFLADIARATGLLPAAAEEALWTLVARGLVTGDGTAGLRTLLKPDTERRPRRLRAVRGGQARLVPAGRRALLPAGSDAGAEAEPLRFAGQLLRRWGVVVRELVARESR